MVFEPVYETLKAEGLSPVLKTQAVVEARLTPPEGTEIQRLLSVSAVSSVSAAEIFSGEARYNGSVDFKALYLAGDGSVGIMETRAEFGDKIADEAVKAKTDAFFRSSVLDVDASGCTAQQFTPACVVEICLFCGDSKEIRHLADCTGDIFDKRERCGISKKPLRDKKSSRCRFRTQIPPSKNCCPSAPQSAKNPLRFRTDLLKRKASLQSLFWDWEAAVCPCRSRLKSLSVTK